MSHIHNEKLTFSILKFLESRKSTLFEFNNLMKKFNIMDNINSNPETFSRKIRAWRQLLDASGCTKLRVDKNKEVCQIIFS